MIFVVEMKTPRGTNAAAAKVSNDLWTHSKSMSSGLQDFQENSFGFNS